MMTVGAIAIGIFLYGLIVWQVATRGSRHRWTKEQQAERLQAAIRANEIAAVERRMREAS